MVHVSHKWRYPRVMVGLFGLEFLGIVAALALFGIADPDTYRDKLWQIGSDAGYCSSPLQILYAYANYEPIPATPLVWSSFPTSYNVVVSVFTMFLLLVKVVMWVMHCWWPLLSTIINPILVALWSLSIYAQAAPDYSDPLHPMPVAWYIAKDCSVAEASGNYSNCLQAKASFAVACIMLSIVLFNLCWGIWSMIPTQEQRAKRRAKVDDLKAHMPSGLGERPSTFRGAGSSYFGREKGMGVELSEVPTSAMRQPYTPRTLAFNTLDRQLPLRSQF